MGEASSRHDRPDCARTLQQHELGVVGVQCAARLCDRSSCFLDVADDLGCAEVVCIIRIGETDQEEALIERGLADIAAGRVVNEKPQAPGGAWGSLTRREDAQGATQRPAAEQT